MSQTSVQTSKEKVESSKTSQIVTFLLGTEHYGVDIMKVQEIILLGDLTEIPEVPSFIKGVINLRGNVIPIIDLRARFKLQESPYNEETRVIVTNVDQKVVGLIVDAVNEVLRISDQSVELPPATISGLSKEYIKGLVKLEKRLLILLEIDQILSLQDKETLSKAS